MKSRNQLEQESTATSFQSVLQRQFPLGTVRGALRWLWGCISIRSVRRERCLRLLEMVNLGEKRFVAVVEYHNEEFLLGGAPGSVSLLSSLQNSRDVDNRCAQKTTKRATKSSSKKSCVTKDETSRIVALLSSPAPNSCSAHEPSRKRPSSVKVKASVERFA